MPYGFIKVAALGLVGLALASPTSALAQEKTTIEWWYRKGGVVEEAIQEMVVTFNGQHENYEVVAVRKGNYEETFAAMIAAYRVGQHPHIIQATERSVLTMLNSNAIIPLNKLMADHGKELDKGDFLGPVASYYVVDDKLSALPFNSSTSILWYNVDHFDAAGFPDGPADTLVVMKDGRIEQTGTHFEVYNNPATTFVARFLGSPGMNILRRSDIGVASDEFSTLPSEHDLLGFRPEAIKLDRTDSDGLKMSREIEGIEVLGPDSLVHLHAPGVKETIIAKVDTDPSLPVSGPIEFEVGISNLHSFDH